MGENTGILAGMLASREEIEAVGRHEGAIIALTATLNNAKKCGDYISKVILISALENSIAESYTRLEATGDYGKEMALVFRECLAEEEEK